MQVHRKSAKTLCTLKPRLGLTISNLQYAPMSLSHISIGCRRTILWWSSCAVLSHSRSQICQLSQPPFDTSYGWWLRPWWDTDCHQHRIGSTCYMRKSILSVYSILVHICCLAWISLKIQVCTWASQLQASYISANDRWFIIFGIDLG